MSYSKSLEKINTLNFNELGGKNNCDNSILSSLSNKSIIYKFKCGACLEDKTMSGKNIEKMECGCTYCLGCLRDLFMNATKDPTLMPPRCHQKNINTNISIKILSAVERAIFAEKLDEFRSKNKFYCQNQICSKFINLDLLRINPHQCIHCSTKNCINCKTLWHPNTKCDKNIRNPKSDIDLDKLKKEKNWKNCPKCNLLIELSSGCNHITCRGCAYEFCFVCLGIWTKTRCLNKCELYSGSNLEVMVDNQINRLGLNRQQVGEVQLNNLRNNIRNLQECRHDNARMIPVRNQNCINCDYLLKHYCYICNDCNAQVCRTCFLHRFLD